MSEPTVEALELPYGSIVGDGATVHADGSDVNPHPDVDAFDNVRVIFTPSDGNGRRVNTVIWTGVDGPTILHPQIETGRFVDGRLVLDVPTPPQPDGMRLMATVSDDMVPNSWGWKMEWTGWPGGKGPGAVIFPLAPGATVDIAEALAGYLPEVPAVEFDNLLAAANEVLAARDETLALRDEVQVISGLTGEDAAVAALVSDPGSETRQHIVVKGEIVVLDEDFASLEAALAATPIGATLEIRQQHTRATPLAVDIEDVTIRFARGGKITATTGHGIIITANGVTIEDAHLVGTGATTAGTADGIRAVATAAAPIERLTLLRPRVTGWSKHGIYLEHVVGLEVTAPQVADIAYGGIMLLSCREFRVRGGEVRNVTQPAGFVNSYGIAMTRNDSQSLTLAPHTSNGVIEGVTVDGVPMWEGIDTHSGRNISISLCTVRNTKVGIALVPSLEGGTLTYAPHGIRVTGCTIDSTVDDGTRDAGIQVAGAVGEFTTGITLTGNTITGHGNDSSSTTGGVILQYTRGATVSLNHIIRAAVSGIMPYHSNADLNILGNTVEDVWATIQGLCAAVYVRSVSNVVTVSGTQITRGGKTASLVNQRSVNAGQTEGNLIIDAGGNAWGNASISPTIMTLGLMRTGFYGKTPVARPATVPVTAAGVHAALVALGLITA